ncbi:unnamed protein product [Mycena citricolor]|uniref:Mid2 domain-containing protein n=1 Tax=Mycena citricolor TaxID=2018698 RepID=A0AAD2K7Q6_9AGAR|nr:unnamed protein product [Mycena citricolor]
MIASRSGPLEPLLVRSFFPTMHSCHWLLLLPMLAAAFRAEHPIPSRWLSATSPIQNAASKVHSSGVSSSGAPAPTASNMTDAVTTSATTGMTVLNSTTTVKVDFDTTPQSPSSTTPTNSAIASTLEPEKTSDASSPPPSPPLSSPTSSPPLKPGPTPTPTSARSTVPFPPSASPPNALTESLARQLSSSPSSPSSSSSSPLAGNTSTHRKSIIIGIVVALLVAVVGAVAGWALYKRFRRRRDRRAWERTHREIADAVRQVNTPAPGATGTLPPSRGTSRASSACAQSGEDVDPFVDEQYDMFDAVASPPSMASVRSQSPLCVQHYRPNPL